MADSPISGLNALTTLDDADLVVVVDVDDLTESANGTNKKMVGSNLKAGLLKEADVDADLKTLVLPADTTISAYIAARLDAIDETAFQAAINLQPGIDIEALNAAILKTTVAGQIAAVDLKATPHDNDVILLEDSEDSNIKKRVTVGAVTGGEAVTDIAYTGIVSGGKASVNGGDNTTIDISAAVYYIQGVRYIYAGVTAEDPVFAAADDTVFVELDSSGLVLRGGTNPAEFTVTSMRTSLPIGRLTSATSGPGSVVSRIRDDRWMASERDWHQRSFQLEAIGNVYAAGGALAISTTAFQLNQESGVLYDVDQYRHALGSLANIGGLKIIASGPTVTALDPIVIPKTYDDGAGGETALATNDWASHTIIKSPKGVDDDGAEGSFVLVISSTNYASEALSHQADPEFGVFSPDQFVAVGRICVRGGSTDIENILDERPIIGGTSQAILSANTIQDVYNNSTTPELIVDATRGALSIEDNATPIGANLLEVSSNGGAVDYLAVDVNGVTVTGILNVTGGLVSVSNGDIPIAPHGTGSIILDGMKWPQADGTVNQVIKTDGTGQLSWTTPAGGGDVSKVGTPVNNQLGIWTGDGTLEGDANITWDGSILAITGAITISGTVDGRDIASDGTKLDGVEALADVTDTANVTAAGALMDSEVDADLKTLSLPSSTTISAFTKTILDDADAAAVRATIDAEQADATILKDADIDSTVQSYDPDTAKTDVDQAWAGSQRATPVTDNDGSFDMDAANDFVWTPAAADQLSFTNLTSGQRGMILLANPSGHTITTDTMMKEDSDFTSTLTAAGTYMISYWCYDGTNVAVSTTGALT